MTASSIFWSKIALQLTDLGTQILNSPRTFGTGQRLSNDRSFDIAAKMHVWQMPYNATGGRLFFYWRRRTRDRNRIKLADLSNLVHIALYDDLIITDRIDMTPYRDGDDPGEYSVIPDWLEEFADLAPVKRFRFLSVVSGDLLPAFPKTFRYSYGLS